MLNFKEYRRHIIKLSVFSVTVFVIAYLLSDLCLALSILVVPQGPGTINNDYTPCVNMSINLNWVCIGSQC